MANFNDFVMWRGDLSFIQAPFCEVDGAILSVVSYFDYDIVISEEELPFPLPYKNVISDYLSVDDSGELRLGLIFPTERYIKLLKLLKKSPRYADIQISDFFNEQNRENCYQFSGVTFHLSDGSIAIVFRGTDDTLVGWREDFCMSFMDEIPSQRYAVDYVNFIADKYPSTPIYICGHSKGGNLAVYSSIFARADVKYRIVKAYSYDGPGLSDKILDSAEYNDVATKICTLIPQDSTIGAMFNNGSFKVVRSRGSGVLQHDPMMWEVIGAEFVKLPALTKKGLKKQTSFNNAMQKMTQEEKENFVNIFFSAIEKTGAHTLTDINDAKLKNLSVIIKSINGLSKQDRELMLDLIKRLLSK